MIGTKIVWHYSLANWAVVFMTVEAMRILLMLHKRTNIEIAATPQHTYAIILNF